MVKQDHIDQQSGCNWDHGSPYCHPWPGLFDPFALETWLGNQAKAAESLDMTVLVWLYCHYLLHCLTPGCVATRLGLACRARF